MSVRTRLSTKGQLIIPATVRREEGWLPGAEFLLEKRPGGYFLREDRKPTPSRFEDVAGCLGRVKRSVSVEEMNEAVAEHFRKRWGREYDDID